MIKVTGRKVAIEPIYDEDVTAGGIIIPDIAKERCDQGIVKYVGPEVVDVEIGDYVLFSGYTGTTMRLAGEGILIIMHEDFITCKIEDVDTEVRGLYFMDREGVYFPATYEMAMGVIAKAFSEHNPLVIHDRKSNKPHEFKRGI